MTNMNEEEEFKNFVSDAVREGLMLLLDKQPRPYGYLNWPSVSAYKSGMPDFSEGFMFSGPPDYRKVFQGDKSLIPAGDIPAFRKLLSYVMTTERVRERILPPSVSSKERDDDVYERFLEHSVFRVPLEVIDRFIQINKTMEFSTEGFELVYEPVARSIFLDKLEVDICVPILFVKFGFESVALAKKVSIERMDELFQLARYSIKSYGSGVHRSVLSAATHCLVLRNWYVSGANYFQLVNNLSDIRAFPLETINNFFAALRLITGVQTGYSQVLLRPVNWVIHYKANLPPLDGTSIQAYPSWFENYYWLESNIPEINETTAREIGNLYHELSDIKENSIHIAVKRLNLCFLREDDEDYILDATIGLESLLSDDNRQEMTHKLALRMGALAKLDSTSERNPVQVFREIKKIYSYRSALVHGSSQSSKNKEIVRSDNSTVPTGALAVEYLRMAIKILIENPKYRKPESIDEDLLLGKSEE
jgi:hypothetical protein